MPEWERDMLVSWAMEPAAGEGEDEPRGIPGDPFGEPPKELRDVA